MKCLRAPSITHRALRLELSRHHFPLARSTMNKSRRRFLHGVAAAAIVPTIASVVTQSSAAEPPGPLIIDTHQHLWDLSRFKLPWLENAPEIYRQSYRPQEYAQATHGLNIRAVYMEG